MASQATFVIPPITLPRTTVAQYVNGALKASLNITLFTTPTQFNMDRRRLEAFRLSNRYMLFIYASLTTPPSAKSKLGGNFGPFKITWADGTSATPYNTFIGYNGANPLSGLNFQNRLPGSAVGASNSQMAGNFNFIAAPGTAILVSAPYFGDGAYTVNIALETF